MKAQVGDERVISVMQCNGGVLSISSARYVRQRCVAVFWRHEGGSVAMSHLAAMRARSLGGTVRRVTVWRAVR